ncbi:MAG: hypothetical protein CO113_04020 [Elusimicrobia bacterium CG_4_9_14_3_um_filter_62_55]|nr:MAG: hypothetical protein COR54_02145 [Elusimicrobia bacterium CG22_combo_CG10-13_8_21_14_all_63_91]PJA16170.1 MAG: hypothetical protein COX66_08180 [Elusimicrobia bacterium CG_4_10_14_0_2_um_filter_63_34]PJB26344.1 MAG: hypothetical protein CO113_04020 [Elusimicrobia bacterium CG_4_9_14_3_um_filter_62_55]
MNPGTRAAMFGRSFFLQALWSPAGMQNLGLLFALEPALKEIYPQEQERRRAGLRHMGYFNTNPYMSGFVLGVVARLEKSLCGCADPERAEERLDALKKAMGAALAAVGDAAVWGALQPACAAAAVLAATVSWLFDFKFAALACALGYLALFNAPTLWLRWKGLSLGYDLGENLPAALQEWNWRRTVLRIRLAGFLCAAAAPALLLVREAGFVGWRSALAAAAFGAFFALRRAGWSSPAVYASCVTAAFGFRGVLALL